MLRFDLVELARKVMRERGLEPEFSNEALEQLDGIQRPAEPTDGMEDLRHFAWCSIDNDDSRDLDQLSYGEWVKGEATIWVAVADVDALVHKGSPIDAHAALNTTSVYTPAEIFPMLPEKLSTDLTSLNLDVDRVALVTEIKVSARGDVRGGRIFNAAVRNKAKLAYNQVGNWLEGKSALPEKIARVEGLEEALKCQHEIAQRLKKRRHALGALTLEPIEVQAKVQNEVVVLTPPGYNFAKQLIEHFMIAANHVMATEVGRAGIPILRRVVKTPKRWDRIIEIAASLKFPLPETPDSVALEAFLVAQKKAAPETFPDLSLTIIKLLGKGEYCVEVPGQSQHGHFGLALKEYTHSTAPNRRFPDLIAHRQCKAHLAEVTPPYTLKQLQRLAEHCTLQEDAATKVERHLVKSAAAIALSSQIGAFFEAIVTGASEKGVWVRILTPPVEGRVIRGDLNLDVGNKIRVRLIAVDVAKGHINFER
jgi:VacB/RNase II family 3'-5' exoribonuclease